MTTKNALAHQSFVACVTGARCTNAMYTILILKSYATARHHAERVLRSVFSKTQFHYERIYQENENIPNRRRPLSTTTCVARSDNGARDFPNVNFHAHDGERVTLSSSSTTTRDPWKTRAC